MTRSGWRCTGRWTASIPTGGCCGGCSAGSRRAAAQFRAGRGDPPAAGAGQPLPPPLAAAARTLPLVAIAPEIPQNTGNVGRTLFEPRGRRLYTVVEDRPGDYLVFGSERSSLPDAVVQMWSHRLRSIPMRPGYRSLNLATAVGILAYKAMR